MLRTIIVTIAGVILSLLLISVATYLMLNHTQFGNLAMGDTRGISDPWKTLMSGFWVLLLCVSLPTTTLVAIFVGALTKKHASIAAAIAVLPISIISSGLELRDAWVTALLVISAVSVAASMQRLRKLSREPQNVL
jgi:hypothetical protein